MNFFKNLLKTTILCVSLSPLSSLAEPAIYDENSYQLELPSVAVVSGGKVEGYFSVRLQVLSGSQGFTMLDNAYATALFGPVQTLPVTGNVSATYDKDAQQLKIPALVLGNTSNAPANPLNLQVLTTLDDAYVLGL